MTIDRDNTNGRKHGWFLWGNWWRSTDQTNSKQYQTNQPSQTIPHQPDIPNQPNQPTSIHHFPPPTSYTPHTTTTVLFQGLRSAAHGCLEEFGEMDVVEFASAEVGRGGCRCCGFSGGLKLVGWMVLFIKPLTVTVGYGISYETSFRRKKSKAWTYEETPTENIGHSTLEWRWTVCKVAECQLDLDKLLFRSPNGSKRSIQVAKCSTPTYVNRFQTPVLHSMNLWLGLRDQTHGTAAWCERCELGDAKCRTSKWEAQERIIPYMTMHFMVFCKCIIFQTYTVSFLENWCIFPSTLLQVRLIRREYSCGCECPCLPLHSTGAATCWIDGGAYSLALFLGVDVGGRV